VAACNGSQLKSFTQSRAFLDQARCLDPDLVIVSLGTNEANGEPQNLDEMEAALERLKGALTRGNPKYVAFLIATPPDSLTWKGRLNPRSQMTAARLRAYAEKHGLALWDWQGVMGGSGACLRWREAGLVWKDGVHMTPSGYKAQGRLLLGALMESYERF
jgi:lysophospholipase L1-like esterase